MDAAGFSTESADRRWPRASGPAAAAVLVTLALAGTYAANFADLAQRWDSDPNYSYGYLVVPIALAILWVRRGDLSGLALQPQPLGWTVLVAALAARSWLFERNELWTESATIPVAAAGLVLAFGGWPLLRWALPGLIFLWFMLPLPPRLNMILAGPLQTLATIGSVTLLQALGLPVLREGHVIIIGTERLEVAQACNGLSMLLAFVTLITATVLTVARDRPLWERILLLASAIPIALISNILRIVATAWCYDRFGKAFGDKVAHDVAGWAMMPIGLALIWLELRLLSWVIIEEATGPERLVLQSAYTPPVPAKKKAAAAGAAPEERMFFPPAYAPPAPAKKKPAAGPELEHRDG